MFLQKQKIKKKRPRIAHCFLYITITKSIISNFYWAIIFCQMFVEKEKIKKKRSREWPIIFFKGLHVGFQVGVVSFGPAPCDAEIPAVYTRVAGYTDWVLETIEKNGGF